MIILTGAHGFIGTNFWRFLELQGKDLFRVEKENHLNFRATFKDWDKVKNITHYYRIDISKAPNAKKEYKVRMAPTIIVFKDGIKEEVYKAGLDLECPVTLDELQEHIDELKLGSQF